MALLQLHWVKQRQRFELSAQGISQCGCRIIRNALLGNFPHQLALGNNLSSSAFFRMQRQHGKNSFHCRISNIWAAKAMAREAVFFLERH